MSARLATLLLVAARCTPAPDAGEGALAAGSRVIFTVPAITLINQSVAAFEAEGITDIGMMRSKHPRTKAGAEVQVCSVQTLAKRKVYEGTQEMISFDHANK